MQTCERACALSLSVALPGAAFVAAVTWALLAYRRRRRAEHSDEASDDRREGDEEDEGIEADPLDRMTIRERLHVIAGRLADDA